MGKLMLAIESLTVQSFATTPESGAGGTVVAHHHPPTANTLCDQNTCAGTCMGTCPTCFDTCATCGGTCDTCQSCPETCDLTPCGGCDLDSYDPYTCRPRCTGRC